MLGTHEEKRYHQLVRHPQMGWLYQLLRLLFRARVRQMAWYTVLNHSPSCWLLLGKVFVPFPAHVGSFLRDMLLQPLWGNPRAIADEPVVSSKFLQLVISSNRCQCARSTPLSSVRNLHFVASEREEQIQFLAQKASWFSCNGRNISAQLHSQLSFSQPPALPPDLQQPSLHTPLAPVHLRPNTPRLPTSEFHCSHPLLRCRGFSASQCFSFYWYQSFGKVRNVFLISLLTSEMKHSKILLNRLWNHVWFCGEVLQRRPQIVLLHCFAVFLIFM